MSSPSYGEFLKKKSPERLSLSGLFVFGGWKYIKAIKTKF
jgi:hypothetical protein